MLSGSLLSGSKPGIPSKWDSLPVSSGRVPAEQFFPAAKDYHLNALTHLLRRELSFALACFAFISMASPHLLKS